MLQIVHHEYYWTSAGTFVCKKLQQWVTNKVLDSNTKTARMHICQKRDLHLDPRLFLDTRGVENKMSGGYIWYDLILCTLSKIFKKKGLKGLNNFLVIDIIEWRAHLKNHTDFIDPERFIVLFQAAQEGGSCFVWCSHWLNTFDPFLKRDPPPVTSIVSVFWQCTTFC